MKHLYLIRHAKSSWSTPGLDDIERPLNKRGKRDAPFMGERLAKYSVYPDRIYSSPAKRARKTASSIAKAIGYPKENIEQHAGIYTSDMNRLLVLIHESNDDHQTLFLVGHNYVITDFAEFLTGELLLNIPTCGIVGIAFDTESWSGVGEKNGSMLFFDYPKKHLDRSA